MARAVAADLVTALLRALTLLQLLRDAARLVKHSGLVSDTRVCVAEFVMVVVM
jgi:hypothetical protein